MRKSGRTSNNTTNDNVPALEQHAALQRGDTIQVTNGAVTIQLTGHFYIHSIILANDTSMTVTGGGTIHTTALTMGDNATINPPGSVIVEPVMVAPAGEVPTHGDAQ